MRLRVCAVAAALPLVAGSAAASAATSAAAAGLEAALKACAGLRNDSERLVCYDRTVAQLDSRDAGALAKSVASAEAMFGISGEVSERQAQKAPQREEISSITARVAALREAADGSLLIELDNGQVWLQTDSKRLLLRVGDQVTIARAAMSSFRIATADNRFGRVRRVQ